MATMLDALKNSGLITENQANKVEQEKREQEQPLESDSHEKIIHVENPTWKRLNLLFSEDKSRKFLGHLLHAFLPHTKVVRALNSQSPCCLCGTPIISVTEAILRGGVNIIENLKEQVDLEIELTEKGTSNEDITSKIVQLREEQIRKNFGDRKLGVSTPDSNKIMCQSCYTSFYEWVMNEMINGNQFINRTVSNVRKNFPGDLGVQKKNK